MKQYSTHILISFWLMAAPLMCLEDNFDFGTFTSVPELTLATRAKWRIFSQKETEVKEGIEFLKKLISGTEFKKLQPDTQAKIILLLLEGYERTNQIHEGQLLLLPQLKRTELWKSQTVMKAALAKLFFLQDEFKEGDILLKPLCTTNSPAYTPLEKKKIAKALLEREKKIFEHLERVKDLLAADLYIEASLLLEKIVPALLEELAPFQDSALNKKRLALAALFTLAECYTMYNTPKALTLFSLIEKEYALLLSQDLKIKLETLKKIARGEFPKEDLHNLTLQTPSLKQRELLFKAQYALTLTDQDASLLFWNDEIENNPEKIMASPSIQKYLAGVKALLDGSPFLAYNLLKENTNKNTSLNDSFFKKQVLDAYQEALWTRSVICFFVEKNDILLLLLSEAEKFHDSSPRKGCLYALNCMYSGKTINSSLIAPNHPISMLLKASINGEKIPQEAINAVSLIDQLFLNAVALYTKQTQTFEPQSFAPKTDIARVFYAQAKGAKDEELQELLSNPLLEDAHPKLLHLLLTNAIHKKASKQEIDTTLQRFLEIASGYGKRRQALLEYFLHIDTHSEFSHEEKKKILELLTSPPCDAESMLAILYLQKNSSIANYAFPEELQPFICILEENNSALALQKEADKTAEMGQKTDTIRLALQRFKETEKMMRMYINTCQLKAKPIALGVYIQMLTQWTEALFNVTLSDHPFLELEEHLNDESIALENAKELIAQNSTYGEMFLIPRARNEIQELKDALDLLLCTFKGEYDEALVREKALSPDSLLLSKQTIRSVLYLVQSLRKRDTVEKAWPILLTLREKEIKQTNQELALEVAIEKSLCLRDKKLFSQAKAPLAWVINDSTASSLRIKAMVLRAELYKQLKRPELAMRQLEAAKGKGGQWGQIAERKLKELYGTGDDTFSLYDDR